MMIANVLNAWLFADGVVEVHGAAAGDEEDVPHSPIRELAGDVVGELHERRTSQSAVLRAEFCSKRKNGLLNPRRRICALISSACSRVAMMIGSRVPVISSGPTM